MLDSVESWKSYVDSAMEQSVDGDGELHWRSVFERVAQKARRDLETPLEPIRFIREKFLDVLLTSSYNDEDTLLRFLEHNFRWLLHAYRGEEPLRPQDLGLHIGDARYYRVRGNACLFQPCPPMQIPPEIVTVALWTFLPENDHVVYRKSLAALKWEAWTALNAGEWKSLCVLLKYGQWDDRVNDKPFKLREDFNEMWVYIGQIYGIPLLEHVERIEEVWDKLEDIHGKLLGHSRGGFRRVQLIVRTIRAVLLYSKDEPTAEQYMKSLEVYFSALPDPMVSVDEVEELLLYVLGEEDTRHVVDRIVQKWVDLFGRRPYTPRSLLHLCRGSLRKALLRNKSGGLLPNRVALLPLPRAFKDYILCVVPDMTSK